MPRPFHVLGYGILLLPLMGQWGFLLNGWAWLTGDASVYALGPGTAEWSHRLVFLIVFALGALVLRTHDPWLAVLVALAGAQTFVYGPRVTSAYFLVGAAFLVIARLAPSVARAHVLTLLGWSGAVQALMVCAQYVKGLPGVGSFGVSGLAACYIGMTGLLLPAWMLPLILAGVGFTGSRAGLVAFVIGVAVRFAPMLTPAVGVALALLVAAILLAASVVPTSATARVKMQRAMLATWAAAPVEIVLGAGLGAWGQRAEAVQREHFGLSLDAGSGRRPDGSLEAWPRVFLQAHNDAVQALYELGALGMAAIAAWLVRWRRRLLAPPLAPACAVLAVMSLAWSPFYDLRLGPLAAVLLGLGTGDETC